jgi:hypothetical protein
MTATEANAVACAVVLSAIFLAAIAFQFSLLPVLLVTAVVIAIAAISTRI